MFRKLVYEGTEDQFYETSEEGEEDVDSLKDISDNEAYKLSLKYKPNYKSLNSRIRKFRSSASDSRYFNFVLSQNQILPNIRKKAIHKGKPYTYTTFHKRAVQHIFENCLAGWDIAGSLRLAATLNRAQTAFQPNLYRKTLFLLKVCGNQKETIKFLRRTFVKNNAQVKRIQESEGIPTFRTMVENLADFKRYTSAMKKLHEPPKHFSSSVSKDPRKHAYLGILHMVQAILNLPDSKNEDIVPDLRDPFGSELNEKLKEVYQSSESSVSFENAVEAKKQFELVLNMNPLSKHCMQETSACRAYLAVLYTAQKKSKWGRNELIKGALSKHSTCRDWELLYRFLKIYFPKDASLLTAAAKNWIRFDSLAVYPISELTAFYKNRKKCSVKSLHRIAQESAQRIEKRGSIGVEVLNKGMLKLWDALAWSLGNVRFRMPRNYELNENFPVPFPPHQMCHPFLLKMDIFWWDKCFFTEDDPIFKHFSERDIDPIVLNESAGADEETFPNFDSEIYYFAESANENFSVLEKSLNFESQNEVMKDRKPLLDCLIDFENLSTFSNSTLILNNNFEKVENENLDIFDLIDEEASLLGTKKGKEDDDYRNCLNNKYPGVNNQLPSDSESSDEDRPENNGNGENSNNNNALENEGTNGNDGSSESEDSDDNPFASKAISQSQTIELTMNYQNDEIVQDSDLYLIPADSLNAVGEEIFELKNELDEKEKVDIIIAKLLVACHIYGPIHRYCLKSMHYLSKMGVTTIEQRNIIREKGLRFKESVEAYEKGKIKRK